MFHFCVSLLAAAGHWIVDRPPIQAKITLTAPFEQLQTNSPNPITPSTVAREAREHVLKLDIKDLQIEWTLREIAEVNVRGTKKALRELERRFPLEVRPKLVKQFGEGLFDKIQFSTQNSRSIPKEAELILQSPNGRGYVFLCPPFEKVPGDQSGDPMRAAITIYASALILDLGIRDIKIVRALKTIASIDLVGPVDSLNTLKERFPKEIRPLLVAKFGEIFPHEIPFAVHDPEKPPPLIPVRDEKKTVIIQ